MAIERIVSQDASGTNAGATVSATYAASPTKGNLLVAFVMSVKGPGTNTLTGWTNIQETTWNTSAHSATCFAKISDGTESATVTATAAAATNMRIAIFELSGAPAGTAPKVLLSSAGDNLASTTARNENGTGWPTDGNLHCYHFSFIGWHVAVGAGSQQYGGGTPLYASTRFAVHGESELTDHSTHVVGGGTTHARQWNWTTNAFSGIGSVTFAVEEPTQMMTGIGPT